MCVYVCLLHWPLRRRGYKENRQGLWDSFLPLLPKVSCSWYFIRPQTHQSSVWYCPGGSAGEFCICLGRRARSLCAAGRSESSWCRREPGITLRSEPEKKIVSEMLWCFFWSMTQKYNQFWINLPVKQTYPNLLMWFYQVGHVSGLTLLLRPKTASGPKPIYINWISSW